MKKERRRVLLLALSILLIAVVLFCLIGGTYYWYRRHRILYDVDTITATQVNGYTTVTIEGRAKQWWFDFGTHTFWLKEMYQGGSAFYCNVTETELLTTKPFHAAPFRLTATFESSEWRRVDFEPVDENGREIEEAKLRLWDYRKDLPEEVLAIIH